VTTLDDIEYTEKDGKKFYKLTAGGKIYRAFSGSIAFVQFKEGKFKKGDNANLKYIEVPGKARDGSAIKHKNLDRLDQASDTGNVPSPLPRKEPKPPVVKSNSVPVFGQGDMTDEDFREYQKMMFLDCLEDSEIAEYELPADKKVDVAIAFFEKRCSPRIYARKESK